MFFVNARRSCFFCWDLRYSCFRCRKMQKHPWIAFHDLEKSCEILQNVPIVIAKILAKNLKNPSFFLARKAGCQALCSDTLEKNCQVWPKKGKTQGNSIFFFKRWSCRRSILGLILVKNGSRRLLLQVEDQSGSRPHSFPGLTYFNSGMSPRSVRSEPGLVGSEEI